MTEFTTEILKKEYGISPKIIDLAARAEEKCEKYLKKADEIGEYNGIKVLKTTRFPLNILAPQPDTVMTI